MKKITGSKYALTKKKLSTKEALMNNQFSRSTYGLTEDALMKIFEALMNEINCSNFEHFVS